MKKESVTVEAWVKLQKILRANGGEISEPQVRLYYWLGVSRTSFVKLFGILQTMPDVVRLKKTGARDEARTTITLLSNLDVPLREIAIPSRRLKKDNLWSASTFREATEL